MRDSVDPAVFNEVAQVLDPQGKIREQRQQIEVVSRLLPNSPHLDKLRDTSRQAEGLLYTAARANQLFSPRGWGLTSMPVPVLETATAVGATDPDRGDEILADAWTEDRVDRGISRLELIYSRLEMTDGLPVEVGIARWRLMQEAKRLHFDGSFAASVPIMLANIEGFAADAVAGKLFFTTRDSKKIAMLNPARLTGMVCALTTLHALYTRGVGTTTTDPVLSRHGIMHGRVLGYPTRVVSAKVLTLFDALADILI